MSANWSISGDLRYRAWDPFHEPEPPRPTDIGAELELAHETGEHPMGLSWNEIPRAVSYLSEGESLEAWRARTGRAGNRITRIDEARHA